MTPIRWSPQAADDLEAVRDFIARDSDHYAKLVVQRIVAAIELLATSPQMGRVVPELRNRDLRELIVGAYRIIYRHRRDVVEIVTIPKGPSSIDASMSSRRKVPLASRGMRSSPRHDPGNCLTSSRARGCSSTIADLVVANRLRIACEDLDGAKARGS